MRYDFAQLKQRYNAFQYPAASVDVEGKAIGTNRQGLIVGSMEVDLTSGMEASVCVFRIYGCVEEEGSYKTDALKPFISLGSKCSVSIGYEGDLTEVFRGLLVRTAFVCDEEGIPCVEAEAMDIKGMMMANTHVKQLRAKKYAEAVKEILSFSVYQSMQSGGMLESTEIQATPGNGENAHIDMVLESDYEFVAKAAKKFHYEFFTDVGKLYFREARKSASPLIEIGNGKGLLDYRIEYDLRGLVREVEARGVDDEKGELIAVRKKQKNKISLGNKADRFLSGTEKIIVDDGIRTKEEAGIRAEAVLKDISYRYGRLECSIVGLPEIKPGTSIALTGLGKGADNEFYVTSVSHVISEEEGFQTRITGEAAQLKE